MAYIQAAAIITRIREIVEEGHGVLRTIAAGRYTGGFPDGLGDEELARRGVSTSKPVQVTVRTLGRHPASPPVGGNLEILRVGLEVRAVRTLAVAEQVDDDVRATLEALALEDVDVIRQALEWPPNLATTQAGAATDLQALWMDADASRASISRGSGKAYAAEYRLVFEGVALSRPSTGPLAVLGAFNSAFDEDAFV